MTYDKSSKKFVMTESEFYSYEDSSTGLCVDCGAERECCEPDARRYRCDECGAKKVYGVPELLCMNRISFSGSSVEAKLDA